MVEKKDKAPVDETEDDIDIDLDYLLEEGLEATDKEEKREKKAKKAPASKKPPVRKSAAKKEAPKPEKKAATKTTKKAAPKKESPKVKKKKMAVKGPEEKKLATKKATAKKEAPVAEKKKTAVKEPEEEKPVEKKAKTSVKEKEEKTDSAAKKEKKVAEKKTPAKKESVEKSAPKKEKAPAKAKKVKKEEKVEEDVLVVEDEEEKEDVYVAKLKPALPDDVHVALKERAYRKRHQPDFKRQEWFRYKRLGTAWRRPRGIQSKMRRHFKYRVNIVSIGYGTNKLVRNLHPSGFEEVLVYRPLDLEDMDPTLQAARIGHSVGSRKREKIEKRAKELGIRVLNRSG